ncbi:hypothetical protein AA313_de0205782 [Arthrobotrys entomopaga]|nr:hypothetical protein AA313_de0205782 [Arthrobotrys entomopaga]
MTKLVVLGGGESGVGTAILGKKLGHEVYVSDFGKIAESYKETLLLNDIKHEDGKHTEQEILTTDIVMKSPGIPDTAPIVTKLRAKKIPVVSEIEYAFKHTKAITIGITGSNGKTTTTTLTHLLLQKGGLNVGVGGNIGDSFARQVAQDKYDNYVLELSSFQLDGIVEYAPHIAVITNISPDHLDRYEYKYEKYIAAKFRITMNQTKDDYLIYDTDDEEITKWFGKNKTQPRLVPFSITQVLKEGAYLNDGKSMEFNINGEVFTIETRDVLLEGKHNFKNVMAAVLVAKLMRVANPAISEVLGSFGGVEHRQEKVRTVGSVQYINDSKATNVASAFYGLDAMTTRTVWIVGGVDKGNEYSELMPLVREKVTAIVCLGVGNRKIIEAFSQTVEVVVEVGSMVEAVLASSKLAKQGETKRLDFTKRARNSQMDTIHNVYFIGIGGIGMSALARYFKNAGKSVAGCDKTPTPLTQKLQTEGMLIHFEDNVQSISKSFTKENTLIVITPAVPPSHTELIHFQENGYSIKKRAEVLGIITKETYCLAVAGTHGKTTTTSILAHILFQSGVDVAAFVGGVVENYGTNLIGHGTKVTVVEADEFDRSFLHLNPDMACITSMDPDHLDIYGDRMSVETAYREFAAKVKDPGCLFVSQGLPLRGTTVGVENEADFKVINIRINNGEYFFDVETPDESLLNLRLALPGQHNLRNAAMALGMARKFGVSVDDIREALASFKAVKRRFSYQIKTESLVYIDDYAHHPTEIDAVHQALQELYPSKKVLAVFQPQLFSRTRDFADDFAKSLSKFDTIFLLDIYPARELPIEGVTSNWLLSKIKNPNKKLVSECNLIREVIESKPEIVLTIGPGNIGELVPELKKALSEML